MKLKSFLKIILTAGFLAGILLWFDMGYNRWSDRKIKDSIVTGYTIIEALNSYHAGQKKYPASLSELVPEYLSEIKKPAAGTGEWEYSRKEDKYHISFQKHEKQNKPYIYYDLIYKEWIEIKK